MKNEVTLPRIIKHLAENKIEYTFIQNFSSDAEILFSFASIKNIIPFGIYFLQETKNNHSFDIQNSIIITNKEFDSSNNLIVVDNPQLVHYELCSLVSPVIEYQIAKNIKRINNPTISKNVFIGENCVIGNAIIEEFVVIKHNVIIEDNVLIKKGTFIDSNSVIGASGFSWIWDENRNRIKQPQLGGVIIEENCRLGTDVTVVRGSLSENTTIGKETIIAHGTKIGHGAQIGDFVHMANNVSLAGNSIIGDYSFLGSASIISSNIKIPKNTIIGAGTLVNKNFQDEYCTIAGVPGKIIKKNNYESKPNGAPKPFKPN